MNERRVLAAAAIAVNWIVSNSPISEKDREYAAIILAELRDALSAPAPAPAKQEQAEVGELVERLAELEHKQWMEWARSIANSEPFLTEGRKERWANAMLPYHMLSEEQKEQDRFWARKAAALLTRLAPQRHLTEVEQRVMKKALLASSTLVTEPQEDMVLVPREPTSEMIQAMEDRQIEGATYIAETSVQYALWKEVYRAMLAAAQSGKEGK